MARKKGIDILAERASKWVGSGYSVALHTSIFIVSGLLIPFVGLDRVLLVLTTLVSLEAIYLSIFIQMSVNNQHRRIKGIEDDIDDILEDTEELTE